MFFGTKKFVGKKGGGGGGGGGYFILKSLGNKNIFS